MYPDPLNPDPDFDDNNSEDEEFSYPYEEWEEEGGSIRPSARLPAEAIVEVEVAGFTEILPFPEYL